MNDLSVINGQNIQATRAAAVQKARNTGYHVLVLPQVGIISIGDYRLFDTAQEARTAAQGDLKGWVKA